MKKITVIVITSAFIFFSIVLAVLCTGVYKMNSATDACLRLRDASDCFTDIVRACDDISSIRIASVGGEIPALVMAADVSDNADEAWYFTYNGYLRKVLIHEGETVSADSGTEVMELKSSDFTFLADELLEVVFVTSDGQEMSVNIYLPDRKGGDSK
ncbi:MAG: DUF4860 domain-containing protein [Bacillota bacterium]|nr:DUF4860 domain-containing protein [Bacillota bacterium]